MPTEVTWEGLMLKDCTAAALALLASGVLLIGCSGYHLVIDDITVQSQTATSIWYHVTIRNKDNDSWWCKTTRFYGNAGYQAYLQPARAPAGGASGVGRQIPNDPNAAYQFRVLEVGESSTVTLGPVTVAGGIDENAHTPILEIRLESSTDQRPISEQTFKTGTGYAGCVRYGMIRSLDLRTVPP
jgi:hypothetical protein